MIEVYRQRARYEIMYKAYVDGELKYCTWSSKDLSVAQAKLNDFKKTEIKTKFKREKHQLLPYYIENYFHNFSSSDFGVGTIMKYISTCYNYLPKVASDIYIDEIDVEIAQKIIDDLYHVRSVSSIRNYKRSEYLSKKTVRRIHKALKYCFNGGVEKGILKTNPFNDVISKAPYTIEVSKKQLDVKEMKVVLNCISNPITSLILYIMVNYQCNINQLLALRWNDIKFSKEQSTITFNNIVKRYNKEHLPKDKLINIYESVIKKDNTTVLVES